MTIKLISLQSTSIDFRV